MLSTCARCWGGCRNVPKVRDLLRDGQESSLAGADAYTGFSGADLLQWQSHTFTAATLPSDHAYRHAFWVSRVSLAGFSLGSRLQLGVQALCGARARSRGHIGVRSPMRRRPKP